MGNRDYCKEMLKMLQLLQRLLYIEDTDSREMLDFNIYLSAHDVARFTN